MKYLILFLCWGLLGGDTPAQGQGADDPVQAGKVLYEDTCAQCHRANGAGLPGTFPALNNNPYVLGDPKPVIATVLKGQKGNLGQMPAWQDQLDDRQIAAVVTYIRQAWANRAPAVTPAMVAESRKAKK
jgi:mono/diheme cytochrome c family protein